jgi:hypothetical protein
MVSFRNLFSFLFTAARRAAPRLLLLFFLAVQLLVSALWRSGRAIRGNKLSIDIRSLVRLAANGSAQVYFDLYLLKCVDRP